MSDPERRREDEWFLENERQLLQEARVAREKREKERAALEAQAELERLRAAHFMKCPKCGHDLAEENLGGVKIDRCTFCEGVYFDAGEIDQLYLRKMDERQTIVRRLLKIF